MLRARVAAALALAVFAASPLAPPPLQTRVQAQMDAARISLPEFKRLYDAGKVLVVDTRDAQSYRAGHVPGAILVSQDMVPAKLAEVKASGKLVVAYCT
jgi:predicted sulfurtransferase